MKFGAKVLESLQNITQTIAKELSKQVQKLFSKAQSKIQNDFRLLISSAIRSQPEYTSLKNGELRYNFGIADSSVVDIIVDRFVDSISVTMNNIKVTGDQVNAELTFSIISEQDLNNILYSADAMVLTEKGESLPWLEWLLLRGGDPIILTHKIKIGPSKYSRTGQAIMIPTKSGNWRVPPRYIGTIDNNWITRALSSIDGEITNILSKYIT